MELIKTTAVQEEVLVDRTGLRAKQVRKMDGVRTCCTPCLLLLRNLVLELNFEVVCNRERLFLFSLALTTWMLCYWFIMVSVW